MKNKIEDIYKIKVLKQTSKAMIVDSVVYDYGEFSIEIPEKRRIVTTRLVRIEEPKTIEYRIVSIFRNILFEILEKAPNSLRAEKEIFYRGFNRTSIRYSKEENREENKIIEEIKELYKSPRKSIEEIKTR